MANIWRTERDEISAIKFEEERLHFLTDAFVAVAFVVAYKLPDKWLELEEAGLNIPVPEKNTKRRRQLTEPESFSQALSVKLRMSLAGKIKDSRIVKNNIVTIFHSFLCETKWGLQNLITDLQIYSSGTFRKFGYKKRLIKMISKWILTLQTSFTVSPSLNQEKQWYI